MAKTDPIRPTDDEAREMARGLMRGAVTAALGVLVDGAPFVTRIGFGLDPNGVPLAFLSDIAGHSAALRADPRASLLIGETLAKGDPLTHPRLTLQARAHFVSNDDPERSALAETWLARHPKAKLYIDFSDFRFVRFEVASAFLNGGFGRAFRLVPEDLRP